MNQRCLIAQSNQATRPASRRLIKHIKWWWKWKTKYKKNHRTHFQQNRTEMLVRKNQSQMLFIYLIDSIRFELMFSNLISSWANERKENAKAPSARLIELPIFWCYCNSFVFAAVFGLYFCDCCKLSRNLVTHWCFNGFKNWVHRFGIIVLCV